MANNPDHPKLKILKALSALIETISIAGDYSHDLAGKVSRGRVLFGDNDGELLVSIVETPRPDFGVFAGRNQVRSESWALLIQGWTVEDPVNPVDPLYALLDDVETCLARINLTRQSEASPKPMFPSDFMLGGLIADFQIQPAVVRPRQEQPAAKACFLLPVTVTLATSPGGRLTADTP